MKGGERDLTKPCKIMKKLFGTITVISLIAMTVFFHFEHMVLIPVAKIGVKYMLDLDMHMDSITISVSEYKVTVKGLKVFNPPEFADADKILMDIPVLVIDFKKKTFRETGAFFDAIMLHIKEINIVRDCQNIVNLTKIRALTPMSEGSAAEPFRVDCYDIKIDKVNYIDYTKTKNRIREIVLNVSETYKNINTVEKFNNIIGYKVFYNGKIGNIGVNIVKIRDNLGKLAQQEQILEKDLNTICSDALLKLNLQLYPHSLNFFNNFLCLPV